MGFVWYQSYKDGHKILKMLSLKKVITSNNWYIYKGKDGLI